MYLNKESLNDSSKPKISEEQVAQAIANVVEISRVQGQSLEDLISDILTEDEILDQVQRHWLSKIVTQAWKSLPE